MVYLGDPGGGESSAYSVSADGTVAVGASSTGNAFRWTSAGGMQDLGTLGGYGSAAYDVSANGSVVVGDASTSSGARRAFRWTASTGMQNLSTTYSVGSGSYLVYANAVSADGLHVVGYGYNRNTNRWEAYYTN
jgi:probable HAF family extracellular repeat protein